jgi:hypothetical protein
MLTLLCLGLLGGEKSSSALDTSTQTTNQMLIANLLSSESDLSAFNTIKNRDEDDEDDDEAEDDTENQTEEDIHNSEDKDESEEAASDDKDEEQIQTEV